MMVKEEETYTRSTTDTREHILGKLSLGKLVFLCIISLALSVVGPLSIFAPLPMAVAFLLYGTLKTFAISVGFGLATVLVSLTNEGMAQISSYGAILFVATLLAFAVASIIMKREHPVKGILSRGFVVLGVIAALVGLAEIVSPEPLTTQIETYVVKNFEQIKTQAEFKKIAEAGGEQARIIESILDNPKKVLKDVYEVVFSVVFVGVFFVLWITLFMLLRNGVIWKAVHNYSFGLGDLVRFKVPDQFVYLVILGLGLFLGGDLLGGVWPIIGTNILYCLGVFYFFQGMGIYLEFLTYVRITGLLRSILTLMTIFMAFRIVAFVGLFDMWVNFRKFFKKKEN